VGSGIGHRDDGTSGTVVGLDKASRPAGDALMCNDTVAGMVIPDRIAWGSPRDSAAHGARLFSRHGRAVVRILHKADWIVSLLAGAPVVSDESNALGYSGTNPRQGCRQRQEGYVDGWGAAPYGYLVENRKPVVDSLIHYVTVMGRDAGRRGPEIRCYLCSARRQHNLPAGSPARRWSASGSPPHP